MKYAVGILNWIKSNKILAFLLIGAVTYSLVRIFEAKSVGKPCVECEKQRGELIQALIDIRTELSPVNVTSFSGRPDAFIYALYDTTKPKTQEQKVQKVLSKIDSLLLKYKLPQQKQKTSI